MSGINDIPPMGVVYRLCKEAVDISASPDGSCPCLRWNCNQEDMSLALEIMAPAGDSMFTCLKYQNVTFE